jgi:ABC-type multidrug transport system ATPase subunit
MKHTLEVDSVILDFDSNRVLQDVYMKSETGKVSGLLGRNGTGKSCLMKIIFGELVPVDKSIRLNGNAYVNESRHPDDMLYLPQRRFIPGFLTIKRIFDDFRLDFKDLTTAFTGFDKFYHTKFNHLSGGERRILEIYAILVAKTKFSMLDEPFSQVMPVHVETIKQLILREKQNKGIIVTDHLYRDIVDICDSLYVISNGKTHLTKSTQDLETLGYVRTGSN